MMLERTSQLFGNRNRTMVLIAVRVLAETYPSELGALLGLRLFAVQRLLESFERDGIIVSRSVGRTRVVALNPRFFASKELSALLWAMAKQDPELVSKLALKRRRPRRPGKPGLP
ncbi:MAG: hypothetical protein Q8S33_34595 [Myxococcales bacterium]|nr:hypothetical protein [Myxococcales bacterium]